MENLRNGTGPEYLIVCGLSGAGRTQAAAVLEDRGWFVIDNLPPSLLGKVVELANSPQTPNNMIALVINAPQFLEELESQLKSLRNSGASVKILFLNASDEVLVQRFENTRRRHPLADNNRISEGILEERHLLEPIRSMADLLIDTSELNVHQLRERLGELLPDERPQGGLAITVMSFGYKHGLPRDADMVLDCRFLPNPHWVPELRPHTGLDPEVAQYVLSKPEAQAFLGTLTQLFDTLIPAFIAEGKSYLTIAVGCTGGRHRSVAITEELSRLLENSGYEPKVHHRDVGRG